MVPATGTRSPNDREGSDPPPFTPLSPYGNVTLADAADDVAAAAHRWAAATRDVLAALRRRNRGAAVAAVSALRQALETASRKLTLVVASESGPTRAADVIVDTTPPLSAGAHPIARLVIASQRVISSETGPIEPLPSSSRQAGLKRLDPSAWRTQRQGAEAICPKNDSDWAWLSTWTFPTLYVNLGAQMLLVRHVDLGV